MNHALAPGKVMELDVSGRTARVSLRLPERVNPPAPVVLLCETQALLGHDESDTISEIATSLVVQGIAAATYEPSIADLTLAGADPSWAQHRVDEATAALQWVLEQETLDRHRVGVLGYGIGALIAAALAGRTDQISRLCLLGVPAIESAARLLNSNGEASDDADPPASFLTESLEELDPVAGALAFDRPTLIMHGAADANAPVDDGQPYLESSTTAGGSNEHVQQLIIPRADHAFADAGSRLAVLSHVHRFFADMRPAKSETRRNGGPKE